MIAYASTTGTRRNLRAQRIRGWRQFATPAQFKRRSGAPVWDDGTPAPYALDNGAWTAHQAGKPFDVDGFKVVVARLAADADFVVAPDIVEGGLDSLRWSFSWLPWLLYRTQKVLIAVQDGTSPDDLAGAVSSRVGLFLGGSTEWKLSTMAEWGRFAQARGCYFHVGRVNSVRRIYLCQACGADSFDGTSLSRYAVNANKLDHARRQPDLWGKR